MERANIANRYYSEKKPTNSCWVSIHFNASGMTSKGIGQSARGASIFTLNGQNASDKIAQSVWDEFKKRTASFGITYREDLRDGDSDHEAGFEEFNLTLMPAYLIETLFFDNWQDFQIAKKTEFIEAVTDAHLYGLLNYFNSL
jgi:N-acetylmuramoyl-L-alanine amidase